MLDKVEQTANELAKLWLNDSWKIEFVSNKKFLGMCCYGPKVIKIAKFWIAVLPENEILDTIKHEIAHAYCYENHLDDNHGKNWKIAAVKIGARPIACYAGSVKPPVRYKANCICGAAYTTGDLKKCYKECSFCKTILDYKDQYAGILTT